jgi:hypothetical protein
MSHRHHVLVCPLPLPDTCSSGTWWSAITRLTLPSRLRRHVARLDREPRIDRGPEIMNLDLAGSAVYRHLGAPCRQSVVLDHGAHPEGAAVARPLLIEHVGDRAQQRLYPRLALGQREPERDRIEAAVLAISSRKLSTAKALCALPTELRAGPAEILVIATRSERAVGGRAYRRSTDIYFAVAVGPAFQKTAVCGWIRPRMSPATAPYPGQV